MQKAHKDDFPLTDNGILGIFSSISSKNLSYNSSGYVMYHLDFQSGEYTFMSPSIKTLTGYSITELNNIGFKNIVKKTFSSKKDKYKFRNTKNLSVEEFYAEYLIETNDGEEKRIEDNSFTYVDENGNRLNAVGFLRDTSALQIFIDGLNEEKDSLDRIFDLSDTLLIQVDCDLNIVMINKKGCRILGGSKEEILGKNLKEFIPKNLTLQFNSYVSDLKSDSVDTDKSTVGKLRSLDNQIKFIEWHNTVLRDKHGKMFSIIASGQEITQRRREDKIRKIISEILDVANSDKKLGEIFEFIHVSISKLMKADNFYIAYYNREENILSFPYFVDKYDDDDSPQEIGKGLTEFVLRTGKSALVDKKLDDELLKKGETQLVGPQSEIWLGVPLKIQDKVIGVLVVQDYEDPSTYTETEQQILDVVAYPISRAIERKIVEAEREKLIIQLKVLNASKDQLFSLISHDLRNPFNSLLGFADILTSEFDSLTKEEIREYISVISESAKNLYGMTNNLLHYSRYQLGKYEYKPTMVNLKESLSTLLANYKTNISKKNIMTITEIDEKLSVYVDEDLMNIALGNIIENAIKYSNTGGTIKITTGNVISADENLVKLIIEDEGVGISEDNLKRIENKEMFSTPGTSREFGTGLGLFLSRDFIVINQGIMLINSDEGKGTIVSIILPCTEKIPNK